MGLKKLGTWLKKNIKPIAAVAAVVFPPLAPAIGSALGASAATAAVVGAAALGTGASLVSGDSLGTALTTGALSGLTAGAVQAVAPNAFTGGGLLENIPRVLPEGMAAHLKKGSWPQSELFAWLQKTASIDDIEMNRTFNNGIGMVVVIDQNHAQACAETLRQSGEKVYQIGVIAAQGDGRQVEVN
jgi:hypothetical protein